VTRVQVIDRVAHLLVLLHFVGNEPLALLRLGLHQIHEQPFLEVFEHLLLLDFVFCFLLR